MERKQSISSLQLVLDNEVVTFKETNLFYIILKQTIQQRNDTTKKVTKIALKLPPSINSVSLIITATEWEEIDVLCDALANNVNLISLEIMVSHLYALRMIATLNPDSLFAEPCPMQIPN